MKVLISALLLATVALAKVVEKPALTSKDFSVYNYHMNVGVPKAASIKLAEESLTNDVSRIIGGSVVPLGKIDEESKADYGSVVPDGTIPYQAGLVISLPIGTSVCGGSVISHNRVLTAAHCWWDGVNQGLQMTVVLGSARLFTDGTRLVADTVFMSEWDPATITNDIAVVRTPSFEFSDIIQPIAIPPSSYALLTFEEYNALASGWGITTDGDDITPNQFLSSVNQTVLDNSDCSQVFGGPISKNIVCTSGASGRGICSGDSGGPLVTNFNGSLFLLGISSFVVRGGCELGLPAGYVRVPRYVDWIRSLL